MRIDENKFFLTVAGLLMFLTSTAFILNDLKRRRTYYYLGRGMKKRQVIARRKKPLFYWMIIGVSGASTLVGFASSPVLIIEAITGENVVGFGRNQLEFTLSLAVFLVILYLISSITSRTFQNESLTELGLSRNIKQEDQEESEE
ncbi:MAG: hypothetical protein DMF60_03920 [Acidobacteria bacterium]|nr:MAG: hypothetical protein DMF60_03920 [Acidobacteriota bacterium]